MKNSKIDIDELIELFHELNDNQKYWVKKILESLRIKIEVSIFNKKVLSENVFYSFGDVLRIHHSISRESFSKDKFEYVLEKICQMNGYDAKLAPKGNRGHDISIEGKRYSLKTQANKDIRINKLWISKFMELGKGNWTNIPHELVGLRSSFLKHLRNYDRILSLRAIKKTPHWKYELVEIPKKLLLKSRHGELKMTPTSKQSSNPGYCYVFDGDKLIYQLYFDAGSERKLQIQHLLKEYCNVWASWSFTIHED